MCDDETKLILGAIYDRLDSDEYESGPVKTVGGVQGSYLVRSPYNTECEWSIVAGFGGPILAASLTTPSITAFTFLTLVSAARATYSSGPIFVGNFSEISLDFNVTAITGGTAPTVTFKVSRVGADNILYQLEQATALSAAGVISYNIGTGLDNKAFDSSIQVDMVLTGAPASVTFSASCYGKGQYPQTPATATIFLSSQDPTIYQYAQPGQVAAIPQFGLASNGSDMNNALDGFMIPVSPSQSFFPIEFWQPLGRGANIYVSVVAATGLSGFVNIAFRRKLDRVLHDIPRPVPSTHTPQSRRRQRIQPAESPMTAGAHNRLVPLGSKYEHLEPGDEDTGVLGYMQRRMRNIGR